MSVYKEAYSAIHTIMRGETQVWNDACDVGAVIERGNNIWEAVQTLTHYHDPSDDKFEKRKKFNTSYFEITVFNEWAVSDGQLTIDEARETFRINYTRIQRNSHSLNPQFKQKLAFISIDKV